MKLFISWSGLKSKDIANALRDWIPQVLQHVKPFVSDKDISAGERWLYRINDELDQADFGIICFTEENITSSWLIFEAGALSKSKHMATSKVVPLLFDMDVDQIVSTPITQFQAKKLDLKELTDVINSINENSGENKIEDNIVNNAISKNWPDLEKKLEEIRTNKPNEMDEFTQQELIEKMAIEIYDIKILFHNLLESNLYEKKKINELFVFKVENLLKTMIEKNSTLTLYIIGNLFRGEYSWISNVFNKIFDLTLKVPTDFGKIIEIIAGAKSIIDQFDMTINAGQKGEEYENVLKILDLLEEHLNTLNSMPNSCLQTVSREQV